MSRVIFLLEEPSMKVLLEGLLPRSHPTLEFLCLSHEGKRDLEQSIPKKLRAWREPGVRFIILRDNDGGDCLALKKRLTVLCHSTGRKEWLVRIVCQELEAWYFGEPDALAEAYENEDLRAIGAKSAFCDSDKISTPSKALARLVPDFRKIEAARRMAGLLTRGRNQSRSFQSLMSGLDRLLEPGSSFPPSE